MTSSPATQTNSEQCTMNNSTLVKIDESDENKDIL